MYLNDANERCWLRRYVGRGDIELHFPAIAIFRKTCRLFKALGILILEIAWLFIAVPRLRPGGNGTSAFPCNDGNCGVKHHRKCNKTDGHEDLQWVLARLPCALIGAALTWRRPHTLQ